MQYKKFNHLHVPERWQHYFTKYPQGHTILESLIEWVSQVDSMINHINDWNDYLENFVKEFDKELQKTVVDILKEWQESGFLEIVISEAIDIKVEGLENAIADLNTDISNLSSTVQTNTNKINSAENKVTVLQSDVVALEENNRNNFYNGIIKYGLVGDDNTNNAILLQAAINDIHEKGGGTLYIPCGIYKLKSSIRLRKNVSIEMDSCTVIKRDYAESKMLFINGVYDNLNYAQGYEGDGNIHFKGGTIDLNEREYPSVKGEYSAGGFAFIHGKDITFDNVSFINGGNNHFLEINACKNVVFNKCEFRDIVKNSEFLCEVIQIDMATQSGIPYIGAHDYTPCDNVLVKDCYFYNTNCPVGTHTSTYNGSTRIYHTNIRFINNTIKLVKENGLRLESYKGGLFSGNTIDNVESHAFFVLACEDITITGNNIMNGGGHGLMVSSKTVGQTVELCKNIVISENTIKNVDGHGVRVNTNKDITVINNIVGLIGQTGISIVKTDGSIVEGNRLYGLNKEGVHTYGIWIDNSKYAAVTGNNIDNTGYSNNYAYALGASQESEGSIFTANRIVKGSSGYILKYGKQMSYNNEVMLTSIQGFVTGDIFTLSDDISKFKWVIVCSGAVGSNNVMHSIARGWHNNGFRVGEDKIIVPTFDGRAIMTIDTERTLSIVSTDNNLRYIVGVL